ncbi:protein of unknown function [Vibrio tapetis subsp. tapetis]|uniref:Uncharacterized protein n=1 Tax=Vibrio tapetis subsp. tapetis TaxID=1671868 RepID=A0A2N8ZKQ2_9VIBR|nr:protein of unknown function [Vibrio tapetis subsp. tapetis]
MSNEVRQSRLKGFIEGTQFIMGVHYRKSVKVFDLSCKCRFNVVILSYP